MHKSIFEEFDKVSAKEWKQKIQVDLKGKDYNDLMITSTEEGIDIKPFYHQDQHKEFHIPVPNKWYITKKVNLNNTTLKNNKPKKTSEAYWLIVDNINEVDPYWFNEKKTVIINLKQIKENFILKNSKQNMYCYDPICNFAQNGNWQTSESLDIKQHYQYVKQTKNICVDSRLYHNAGANITQQLAYTLSHFYAYLRYHQKQTITSLNIIFINAVGTNYFFEIAKLKAIRLLFNTLCKNLQIEYTLKIISEPGTHHMSIYDYNVNILRTTTASMSAILGGSDFVANLPYDHIFKKQNDFSTRIAENQLHILKEESSFDKVTNTTDGNYYINHITQALAEKSLSLFKQIEKAGGFIQQLFEGKIQLKIEQQFQKNLHLFEQKQLKIIGSNMYPNENDKMKNEIEKDLNTIKNNSKTSIKPIFPRRLTKKIEEERLREEVN